MSDEKQYEIVYFKASGKYYTSEKVAWPKDAPDHSGWNPLSMFHRIKEMYAVCMDAPHGFPQFSPPKTVYDLQQTIYELQNKIENAASDMRREEGLEEQLGQKEKTIYELNCRVAELKRELVEKDAAEILGFAEGFEEATEAGEKVLSNALDAFKVADVAVSKTVPSSNKELLAMAKSEINSLGEVLDDIRKALGQEDTHYLVMADDVKALVFAVKQCESDGGCRAATVLGELQKEPGCGGTAKAPLAVGCNGTPGAASWGRCEKEKGHPPPCTHDPASPQAKRPASSERIARVLREHLSDEDFDELLDIEGDYDTSSTLLKCLLRARNTIKPGENIKVQDPRFGTPEHMQARWKASGIRGPFFIDSSWSREALHRTEGHGPKDRHLIRECGGRKVVAECQSSEIANAVFDALNAYEVKL